MTGFLQSIITVVLFLAILGILVVIHELGHFVTARLANVRVLEFGIGFPPRAKVLGRGSRHPEDAARYAQALAAAEANRHVDPDTYEALREAGPPPGTLYTLNWLPIGGFVKLAGEDGNDPDDPRSFAAQRWLTKMVILVAGVTMNVLLAFVIFTGLALHGDPLIGARITEVQNGSPAAAAGIEVGDVLVSLDNEVYNAFEGAFILDDVRARAGETITVGVEQPNGAFRTVTVALRGPVDVAAGRGALGVTTSVATARGVVSYTPLDAIGKGGQRTIAALGLILGGLGTLVGSVAADPTAPPPVAGPVGIATQIGDIFWNFGPILTLYVAGILSANLALVNILPFPPLDGGRMLMITLKRVFGRRISLRAEQLTYVVGMVFLFAFILWVTGYDIIRSLTGGSLGAP